MVDLNSRLARIKKMVDNELYFAINKGRQYGKTTILNALANKLKEDYFVLSLDFQFLDSDDFENARTFVISTKTKKWTENRSHKRQDCD